MLRGFNLVKQLSDSKAVIGLNMLKLWDDRGTLEPWIGPLTSALADGIAVPIVHEAVPFAKAAEAHRILANAGERRQSGAGALTNGISGGLGVFEQRRVVSRDDE